jgi:hypothetical protein
LPGVGRAPAPGRSPRAAEADRIVEAPRAQVCGHIHHTEGVAYLGQTKVIKLRAAMANRCALLDLATLRTTFLDLEPGPHATSSPPTRWKPSTRDRA